LESYGEERLPIIAEMLNKTTELLKHVFNQKTGRDASENKLRKAMTQLGVNYRGSSIVYNEGAERDPATLGSGYNKESETAAQPGDRAPEAPGLVDVCNTSAQAATLSLFGIFPLCPLRARLRRQWHWQQQFRCTPHPIGCHRATA
jgi:hypothetical protein